MPAVFLQSVISADAFDDKKKLPQVALLGRSNVGKSSLINHLSNLKSLARTSKTPGMTQTVNLYGFDGFVLADMPGYGFSRANRSGGHGFTDMIGAFLSEAPRLKLVFLIVDGRHKVMQSDRDAADQLIEQKVPYAVICNKVDKLSAKGRLEALALFRAEFPDVQVIPHSVNESKGLGDMREAIRQAARRK